MAKREGMVRNLINGRNIRRLLLLFDIYYKKGVIDAMENGDQWTSRDFVKKMRESSGYGLLNGYQSLQWKEWLTLMRCDASIKGWNNIRQLLFGITSSKGYLGAILPMTMGYYLKGIEDYTNYPYPTNKTLFLSRPFLVWEDKLKGRDIRGAIESAQLMTVDLGQLNYAPDNQDYITLSEVINQSYMQR